MVDQQHYSICAVMLDVSHAAFHSFKPVFIITKQLIGALCSRKTPQLYTTMCMAGISCHANKIRGTSSLRVRHLALFWLSLKCLTHDKEEKYLSCPKYFIPSAQIWSGTYLKKMLHGQQQVRQP